jgi:hypothetical protein
VFQRFGRDGRKAGPEIVVSGANIVSEPDRMRAPAVAPLLDGNFVVSWVAAPNDIVVRAAIFNGFDGSRRGGEFTVNSSVGNHFLPQAVGFGNAGLDDITFVIAWSGGDPGRPRSRFQMFNIDGSKAGSEVVPRRKPVGVIAPAIFNQGVEDPREFISVLGGPDGTEGARVTADLFGRDGNSLGTNVTGADTINFDPSVRALPGQRALVTWTQRPIPTTGQFGTKVMAATLGIMHQSQDFASLQGSPVQIGTTNVGGQITASPMIDESGISRIAFTWVEQPSGSNDQIKARVTSDALT